MNVMNPIPDLWVSPHGYLHRDRLRHEARELSRTHALPLTRELLESRFRFLRETLEEKLRLSAGNLPLDFQVHGRIARDGYQIQRVSFMSCPGIRVTGSLYIPEGEGPFPAVLNMHGHWQQGKIAARVQARGHILALNGFVTLSVDAAGAGERGETEGQWAYHGAMKGAQLFLGGDSLMGQLIRDNRRALDLLQSLPFVDGEKIGATGASGGGNQTMWLSAMDDRVKAAVIVVSTGTFEAYVTECNCLCETLPGGLQLAEEWEVQGMIAPRPLLIINALHDNIVAFQHEPMAKTCRQLQEIYALYGAREKLDWRLADMPHGYHTEPLQAMLGWMKHWLSGAEHSTPQDLPGWLEAPEEDLLCYPLGERPVECGYPALRQARRLPLKHFPDPDYAREELSRLVGWHLPPKDARWEQKYALPNGTQVGAVLSSRSLPLPVAVNADWNVAGEEIRLVLSPLGKKSAFARRHWKKANEAGVLVAAVDLPGVGELSWDPDMVGGARLHDAARACLWLGYTLVGEWAEAIASLWHALRNEVPHARIQIFAEQEAVFAAWLCRVLDPEIEFELIEFDCPASAGDPGNVSMVWCVPGFLPWGDLALLRQLKG